MNWGTFGYSVFVTVVWSFVIFAIYLSWSKSKEEKMDKHEKILVKTLFVGFIIFAIIMIPLFAKVIYKERYRVATGSLGWQRHILPNSGDCDASCKAQCEKDDYRYIADSNETSCDCICLTFCRSCFVCKNPQDDEIRIWIKRMEK
ncbi:hypothetical protein COV19_03465 [Candidatus Woesearchaeota archaeon CG10_big_fil_rev_8_21_14_0_10_44_13]|nr:MAG: hypothetical protein COV19_03465 [Candidatus Woesearchaeota archaeon CG10_big_fil_rev_8_21_14_0_10_44_13]